MTEQQAKQAGYTHHGRMYGVPIYLTNDEDMNVAGSNWFNDLLLTGFVWLDTNFEFNECFIIQKGKKL